MEERNHGAGADLAEGRILVVDDEPAVLHLVKEVLAGDGFDVICVQSARRALVHLRAEPISLLVTDIRMPDEDGLWMLRVVRSQYPHIPVVMMTGLNDTRTAVACLREGAADYLGKPLDLEELSISVRRALHQRRLRSENIRYRRDLEGMVLHRTRELRSALGEKEEAYTKLLEALVHALDAREQDTHNHSLRVAAYTSVMARRLGVDGEELAEIFRGALLHDVGKIGIPDSILLKPAPLSDEEWAVMRTHPRIGARILEGIPFLEGAREIVLSHHERWDGKGYPRGREGTQIPLGARIFAVADAFDVMTSGRPYRTAVKVEVVTAEVERCAGGQFDPDVASLFLRMVADRKLIPRRVQTDAIPDFMRGSAWAMAGGEERPVSGTRLPRAAHGS